MDLTPDMARSAIAAIKIPQRQLCDEAGIHRAKLLHFLYGSGSTQNTRDRLTAAFAAHGIAFRPLRGGEWRMEVWGCGAR